MTEIAVHQPSHLSIPDKMRYAEALAGSSLLPRHYQRQPANLLLALEYAESLGISPISAITGIFVVEGKPSASADLIASLVRRAGHRLRVTGDDGQAVAQLIRADDPDFTYEARWDLAKARAAGLAGKAVWRSYPAAMLRSRAITEVARMGASDALFGVIYTPEELGASVDVDGAPSTVQAPVSAGPPLSGTDRLAAAIARPQPAPEQNSAPTQVVVDAEIVPDTETPGITRQQLTALNAGLTALGYTKREDKLAFLSDELGRPVGSSQELTKAEASDLIDRFKRREVVAPPAAAPVVEPPADWVEEPPADWQPEPDGTQPTEAGAR